MGASLNCILDGVLFDPAMGSAGFLVSAVEYMREHFADAFYEETFLKHFEQKMFHGFDNDTTMLRIGAMNMMLHGLSKADIAYRNSLAVHKNDQQEVVDDTGKYTLVLANPPFKGTLDPAQVDPELLKITNSKHTELLFLAHFLRILSIGGRAVVVVPAGVTFRKEKDYMQIRKALVDENRLEVVLAMPSGVFEPYAGVTTAILVFTKTGHGGTDQVWFYNMKADGFSLTKKREPVNENDIPDILQRWQNLDGEAVRTRAEQSFLVPVDEIRAKQYSLSFNNYMEIPYTPPVYKTKEEYIHDVDSLMQELQTGLEKFKGMI